MKLDTFLNLKTIAATILLVLLYTFYAYSQSSTEPSQEEKARKRDLQNEAALNLFRLKKSIEEENFYAARVALNIWRSTAMAAGTFDPVQYDAFKKQLYEKSVNYSLQCFSFFLEQESFHDANMCLQTWKIHSQEIGIFDQTAYEELQDKLNKARTAKILEREKKDAGSN